MCRVLFRVHDLAIAVTLAALLANGAAAAAAEPGKAVGTFTFDKSITTLAFATQATVENLFDSKKQDILVVLTDRVLGDTAADDEVGLDLRARRGDLVALMLRIDGNKLTNVKVSRQGIGGMLVLPGAWFQFTTTGRGVGTLTLARRDHEGHAYACTVEFAGRAQPARSQQSEAPAQTPAPAPTPKLPPATTSNIDRKAATGLLVQAIMLRDERQALEIIKLGVDPNGEANGMRVLNWAVTMCQPQVVKALIAAKADITYVRVPGMTILTEAGACPEAAQILRAAGAR